MKLPWFVRGDLDGFFGLFIDNLLQLMLITVLCRFVCGFPLEFVVGTVLPGAALSILAGNLFYSWQARRLAARSGRHDVTALPYGINTASLLAFIFLIMAPIFHATNDYRLAWQAGLFACFLSGLMEIAGAFVGDWLRRHTPRAALLSALAGIAITFISMGFVFQIFASPVLAILPMMMILILYASHTRLPLSLPGGFVAVVAGVSLAWILRAAGFSYFQPGTEVYSFQLHPPQPYFLECVRLLRSPDGWRYLSVILPMGLFNIIGSLQNLESAEAAGDCYPTRSSLLANGVGGLCAAFFGSPFPTTIYIGHPAWKAMGARSGYSALNGIVITALCLVGGITFVLNIVPLEATLGILLWIGLVITAQSFQEVPKNHAIAVAFGLVPSLAAWALVLIETSVRVSGATLADVLPKFGTELYINGVIALSQGFLLSSMGLAALLVYAIEHNFLKSAAWAGVLATLSLVGLIHAFEVTPTGVVNKFSWAAAPHFAVAYAATAVLLIGLHIRKIRKVGT